jgi:uncharacterized protein involved in exopolysaccharide biosynthesis
MFLRCGREGTGIAGQGEDPIVAVNLQGPGGQPVLHEPAGEARDELWVRLDRLWARRCLIAVSIAVCTIGCVAAAFLMTPMYRVEAVLVPANTDRTLGSLNGALGGLGGLTSLAGISIAPADTRTQEALAVLNSRELTQKFIEERGLMPELFPRDWDAGRKAWKMGLRHPPTVSKAYKYFNGKIRAVTQDRKTGLIVLSVYWRDRIEAAAWANELVQRLNVEMRARAIAQANDSLAELERELLATTVVETRQAISRLIDGQVKQRMVANVTPEYVFRVVDQALPPDADDPTWPNRPLLFALGPLIGLTIGALLALVLEKVSGGPSRAEGTSQPGARSRRLSA